MFSPAFREEVAVGVRSCRSCDSLLGGLNLCAPAMAAPALTPRPAYWERRWADYEHTPLREREYESAVDAAVRLLGEVRAGWKVIDLGSGTGHISEKLANRLGARVVACDLSSQGLRHLRARRPAADAARVDAYRLPFADRSVDLVVSFGRESVGGYVGVGREIRRVLKPGGVALVDFVNHHSLYEWVLRPARSARYARRWRRREPKANHWGLAGVRDHFRAYGLELEATAWFFPFPNWARLDRARPSTLKRADEVLRLVGPVFARGLLVRLRAL